MAWFGRGRKRDLQQLEDIAGTWWPKVPTKYPDGTPFPARESFDAVLAVARKLTLAGGPADAYLICMKLLAEYTLLTDPTARRAYFNAVEIPYVRQMFLDAGMISEERAISNAAITVFEYHEKAGHRIIMNIDPQGNMLDVDQSGNLLDTTGNVLPIDELGRAIYPEA